MRARVKSIRKKKKIKIHTDTPSTDGADQRERAARPVSVFVGWRAGSVARSVGRLRARREAGGEREGVRERLIEGERDTASSRPIADVRRR